MGPIALLVLFSLLHLSKGEVTPLFVKTGKDLLLEVKETVTLEENDQLTWTVNSTEDIARLDNTGKPTIFKSHSGRAELFPQNQSFLLRSLTKSDSGGYRARVSGDNPKVVAEYKVTVLDPVSPVKLTVKSCSSDSSNLTVTCSTQDSLINTTFTCDNKSCSEERRERAGFTTPAASLKVYLKNNSIICVHSNQVSRTEDVRKIEDLCKKKDDFQLRNTVVTAIVVTIFLIIVIILVIICHGKNCEYKREYTENTVYDVPQVAHTDELLQRPTGDAPTIYSLLGKPTVTEASPQAGRGALPESLYASVQKTETS